MRRNCTPASLFRAAIPVLCLLFWNSLAQAQTWIPWGPNDFDKLTYKNARFASIAFHNGETYVAYDQAGVSVKKLRADGSGWDLVGNAQFSGPVGGGLDLQLRFANGSPHVAFKHVGTSNRGIMRRYNGTSWEIVGGVPFSTGNVDDLRFEVAQDQSLYVLYRDVQGTTVKRWNGNTWENIGTPGFVNGTQLSLAISGNTPYIAFNDPNANSGATVMKFNGTGWEVVGTPGFTLSMGWGFVYATSLAFDGTTPYLAYTSDNTSGKAAVQKFNGTSWELVGSEGFSAGQALELSLVVNNGVPHLAYRDNGPGKANRATVKKFDGTDWITVGTEAFTPTGAYNPSFVFNGTTPYIAFGSGTTTSTYIEASVMKLNSSNTGWERVGAVTSLFVPDPLSRFKFSGKTPYICYKDSELGNKGTVKKFDGHNWVALGAEGFTPGSVNNFFDLVFDANQVPHVYFLNSTNSTIGVMKFNGTAWVDVGATIASNATPLDLFFDNTNAPCVTFRQAASGNNTFTMRRFNGSSWQLEQSNVFANGSILHFGIHYINDVPAYMIYPDQNENSKATVKQFNGSTWVTMGTAGFTPAAVQDVHINFLNGAPHIAFRDAGAGWGLSVMKFDGTNWVFLGNRGFQAGDASRPRLIFNNNTLYVAYKDGFFQFDGSNWQDLGDHVSKPWFSSGYNLLFHGTTPYVAYTDAPAGDRATVKKFTGAGNAWTTVGNNAFTSDEATALTMNIDGDSIFVVYKSYRVGVYARKIADPGTLPVSLISFIAEKEKEGVKLHWATATESNNSHFIISHSTDGIRFQEIGRVNGAQQSMNIRDYSFYHASPIAGKNYYRLEQVDHDGRKQSLGVRLVQFAWSSQVKVYPNPSVNNVHVVIEPGSYQSLQVLHLSGSILRRIQVPQDASVVNVLLADLPPGTYLLQLVGRNGTQVARIVKQ